MASQPGHRHQPRHFGGNGEDPCGNAKDKLGARDRTQMAVMALLHGLIDPLDP